MTGVQTCALPISVVVSWSLPPYSNHATTIVYRGNTPSFGSAVEIGSSPGQTYTESIGNGVTRYYWVKFVSTQGVSGPITGPASATTPKNPGLVIDEITERLRQSNLYADLQAEVEAANQRTIKVARTVDGQEVVGGIGLGVTGPDSDSPGTVQFGILADQLWLANPNVDYSQEDKVFPFIIKDGTVYIDVAMIEDASITTAKIADLTADKLTVGAGGAQIARALLAQAALTNAYFYNKLESGGVKTDSNGDTVYEEDSEGNLVPQFESTFSPGSSGFRIDARNGNAEFNNIVARGQIEAESGRIYDNVVIGPEGSGQPNLTASEASNWKKPGTTKIDGAQITADEAFVTTLFIENQAVTFPEEFTTTSSYDGYNTNVTADMGWTEVMGFSITISPSVPVVVFPIFTFSCNDNDGVDGTDVQMEARLTVSGAGASASRTKYAAGSDTASGTFTEYVIATSTTQGTVDITVELRVYTASTFAGATDGECLKTAMKP